MKDDIKETLEDVKRHLDYVEATKQCSIRDNEMKAMYDYITNLQEENERLKEILYWKQIENNIFYKARCEKAIEYIKENCIDDEFYINLTNKEKNIIKVLDILEGEE